MRKFLLSIAVLLPQPVKQALYRHLFGWEIGRGVHLGWSYLDARSVTLADGVRIGHFNIFRGIQCLEIGSGTYVANFNQFFGAGIASGERRSELRIGSDVNFMSRHFVDVAGLVEIGTRATIGGRDTQIWSHTLRIRHGQQTLEAVDVRIGAGVYVGARATIVCCQVPPGAMIGAGAVLAKSYPAEACRLLLAGNPATIVKRYTDEEPAPDPAREQAVSGAVR